MPTLKITAATDQL